MTTIPYHRPDKWRRNTSPPSTGRIEARAALRVLMLSLVQAVDDPTTDLWELGRQCESVGLRVQEEVAEGATP